MHNIDPNVLSMTLGQLGLESWATSIARGVTELIVDGIDPEPGGQPTPESEKFEKDLREFIDEGRKNPEAHKEAFLKGLKEMQARTVALTAEQTIAGWEKHYNHHRSHRPSVVVGMFFAGMAEFFKKLLEVGVTEEQLGHITGAKEQIEHHDLCNRLREESFKEAKSRGYI